MKILLRHPDRRWSGYVALTIFLLAYSATMALVIAPDRFKAAKDAPLTWILD